MLYDKGLPDVSNFSEQIKINSGLYSPVRNSLKLISKINIQ